MSFPAFTNQVPDNGYRWWYLDATSDDGQHAITVIAFIGSVFSPYYARARKKGRVPADSHCAVNVALYGRPWRWCMTERTAASVRATSQVMSMGKSTLSVNEGRLQVSVDEMAMPIPMRVSGQLSVELPALDLEAQPLDRQLSEGANHFWQPIAPRTRINVSFDQPKLSWRGNAYVDANYGNVPLESSFRSWVWSRSHCADNTTTVLYDVVDRQGNSNQRSFCYAADGSLSHPRAPQQQALAPTRYWRIPRAVRTAAGTDIENLQTLEDTPFYSRSRFIERQDNTRHVTVHESLYLQRFDTPWVRALLPFRMPRNTRPVLLD